MTLEQLIKSLKYLTETDLKIKAGEIISYRGYYSDVCFEVDSEKEWSIKDFVEYLESKVGTKMEGYKSGEYEVTLCSDVFVAYYGSTGSKIESLKLTASKLEFDLNSNYL